MYFLKHFVFCLFFLSWTPFTVAQELVVDKNFSKVFVDRLSVYTDSIKVKSNAQIVLEYKEGRFVKTKSFGDGIGVGNYNYWLVLDVKNPSKDSKEVVFEIPIARLDSFSVFSLNKFGILTYEASCTGIGTNIDDKPLRSFAHAVKINIAPNSSKRLFFKLHKFPGSLRASIIAFSPKMFDQKQRQINSYLSFFIGIALIVILTSMCVGFLKKDYGYYVFSLLTILKLFLILQLYNYSQLLETAGFDNFGTSVYLMLALYLQYFFFNLYFFAKPAKNLQMVVILAIIIEFFIGKYLQGYKFYYFSQYGIAIFITILFLKDTFQKFRGIKSQDVLFIGSQTLALFFMVILVLKFKINIFNNYFRKYDYESFYLSSLFELFVYLTYLILGMIKLNKSYIKKSKALIFSQNAIIETQENERQRIAQDLHDDLGATLAMLNSKGKKENFSIENQNLIEKAIKDLRSISRNLLPSDFEAFGLIASVEKYLKSLNEQQKVKFTFINFGERVPLKHDTELNIYRIITELSNNVMKHSKAQNATVQLIYHPNHLFVSVEDDGKGLEISKDNLGIGLKNVISRIEYLQAKVLELGTGPFLLVCF